MNKLKIRPFLGRFLLTSSGTADIIDAGATIKKLTVTAFSAETLQGKSPARPRWALPNLEPGENFLILQAFSIMPVISQFQLESAVEQTLSSFEMKSSILSQPSLEFLLRLSGKRELDDALDVCGLNEGKQEICIAIFAGTKEGCIGLYEKAGEILCFREDETLIEKNFRKNKNKIMELFEIPLEKFKGREKEEKLAESFAIEKAALLSLGD